MSVNRNVTVPWGRAGIPFRAAASGPAERLVARRHFGGCGLGEVRVLVALDIRLPHGGEQSRERREIVAFGSSRERLLDPMIARDDEWTHASHRSAVGMA